MNSIAKFAFSIGLLGLLCLMLPGSLRADTIYTYTGTPFTTCYVSYTCNGTTPFLSITFDTTLSGAQLDNLSLGSTGVITATVTSFTFNDNAGFTYIGPALGTNGMFDIGTDASGHITSWALTALGCLNHCIAFSNNTPTLVEDESNPSTSFPIPFVGGNTLGPNG